MSRLFAAALALAYLSSAAFAEPKCGIFVGDRCSTIHFVSAPSGALVTVLQGSADDQNTQCTAPCALTIRQGAAVRFEAHLAGYHGVSTTPVKWKMNWGLKGGNTLLPDPVVFEFAADEPSKTMAAAQ